MLQQRLHAYLTYFEHLATQPPNQWQGFYLTQREAAGFGLRHQLAFPCYALAALCLHPQAGPAEQERCRTAMAALIDRMLQRRVWAYWAVRAEQSDRLLTDPALEGNCQYSGHLAMMLGVYRAAGGDARYDEPFTLFWSHEQRFGYTHTKLVETLWRQMNSSAHHGIEDEPGEVSVAAMNQVLWATALHDALCGSTYATANAQWLAFLREQLVAAPGLFGRSIFVPCYTARKRWFGPAGQSFIDAWTLALLNQLAPEMTQELAPRLLATIRHIAATGDAPPRAYVPAASKWQKQELADPTIATGFGCLLAVELEDEALAAALRNYADQHFAPLEQDGQRCYTGGLSAPYTTALFALSEADGLRALGEVLRRAAAATEQEPVEPESSQPAAEAEEQPEEHPTEH